MCSSWRTPSASMVRRLGGLPNDLVVVYGAKAAASPPHSKALYDAGRQDADAAGTGGIENDTQSF